MAAAAPFAPPRARTVPAPEVRVRGELVCDAEVRSAGGRPRLEAVIGQPDGPPILVRRNYDPSNAGWQAAHSKARLLRRGATCTAHGSHLTPTTHAGKRALQLTDVSAIDS